MAEVASTVYFAGTAGAGKTHLVRAFASWLKSAGYDPVVVNLDPGNETTELEPDVDIRDWVRLDEVMDEYSLGPNGAQVAAADMIALKVFDVRQAVGELKADYVLVDTPGQVELFAFRESSKAIVDALSGDRSAIAFLFDPSLARSASGMVSLLMLAATVEFRFRLPMVHLLSKADVLTAEQLDEVVGWGDDPERLMEAVGRETPTPDVQLSMEMLRTISALSPLTSLLPTSSEDQRGLEALYHELQRSLAGGEDLEPSHAPPEGP